MQIDCVAQHNLVKAELRYDSSSLSPADFAAYGVDLPFELRRAVKKRQIDYLAGRYCARSALIKLGSPSHAVYKSEDRCPVWPQGYTGSITHTKGYAAALVAPSSSFISLGIDSEWRKKDTTDIKDYIRTERENILLYPSLTENDATVFTFSAKESLFKCLYPLARVFFGFHDARLLSIGRESFAIELLKTLPNVSQIVFSGTYALEENLIHTQILLPLGGLSPKAKEIPP